MRAALSVDSAVSDLRLSTPLGPLAWPDDPDRDKKAVYRVLKQKRWLVHQRSCNTAPPRARLGEPSESER